MDWIQNAIDALRRQIEERESFIRWLEMERNGRHPPAPQPEPGAPKGPRGGTLECPDCHRLMRRLTRSGLCRTCNRKK